MIWSSTVTNRWATDPVEPSWTLPTVAEALPSTLVTATPAPAANAPTARETLTASRVRWAMASTSTPPPALVTPCAPTSLLSMCAFWVPVSLTTATTAPTATNPAVPAKATAIESSSIRALTLTWPSAVMGTVT